MPVNLLADGNVDKMFVIDRGFGFSSINAQVGTEFTFNCPGIKTTDVLIAIKPTHVTGLVVSSCRCSADGILALAIANYSAGALTPASQTYRILVIRADQTKTIVDPG